MRFVHSSDLQIGKVFGYFDPAISAVLQDARQATVRALGELAVKHGASAVLMAGIFTTDSSYHRRPSESQSRACGSFPM